MFLELQWELNVLCIGGEHDIIHNMLYKSLILAPRPQSKEYTRKPPIFPPTLYQSSIECLVL